MMTSVCHICGKPALRTCVMCGQPTCKDHMDEKGIVCIKCVPGAKKGRASGGPDDPGGVMG